jgi:glucokinase
LNGYAIGLDIGGTNMVAGIVNSSGKIISRQSVPSESRRGHEDGLRRISELIDVVLASANLTAEQTAGIGIGSTGPINTAKGLIQNPYTLPGWEDLPIGDYLTNRFHLPTYLIGDCQVAALGEHWMGAGKGSRHMIYITVGTGIGSGLILNGNLYAGMRFLGGEIGHHVIDVNGPSCYCGAKGCWEMLAAAPAIARIAAENAPENGLLMQLANHAKEQITAALVSKAAVQGDAYAGEIMRQTGYYLGVGLANLMNIFAPEMVVMGGGVMGSWDMLSPIMFETIHERAGMMPFHEIKIVPAQLGLNAGITGAARAVLDYLDRNV